MHTPNRKSCSQSRPKKDEVRDEIVPEETQLAASGLVRRNTHSAMMARSVFGVVRTYSLLPEDVIKAGNVKKFQKRLTALAKRSCANGQEDWKGMFGTVAHRTVKKRGNPIFFITVARGKRHKAQYRFQKTAASNQDIFGGRLYSRAKPYTKKK